MNEFEELCAELYGTPVGDTVTVSTHHGWSDYVRHPWALHYAHGTHDQLGREHVYGILEAAMLIDALRSSDD